MSQVFIIIPARLDSVRLPRKLLLAETGKTVLQHVWESASQSRMADDVTVVADGYELCDVAKSFGAEAVSSIAKHPNGTSRAAEAFDEFISDFYDGADDGIVVVLQADVPEVSPDLIDCLAATLKVRKDWDCATAAALHLGGIKGPEFDSLVDDLSKNPNRVKLFTDETETLNAGSSVSGFIRNLSDMESGDLRRWYIHIGIYAYRAAALRRYAAAGPCEDEQTESLEQLRALHIGLQMGVVFTDHHPAGIDTREDYDAFVKRWKAREKCES